MAWTSFSYTNSDGTTENVDISKYYGGDRKQRGITTEVNGVKINYDAYGKKGNDAKVAYLVNYYLHHGDFGDIPAYKKTTNEALSIIKDIAINQLGASATITDDQLSGLFKYPNSKEYAPLYASAKNRQSPSSEIIDPNTGEPVDPDSERAKEIQREQAQDTAYNSYWNNLYQKDREGTLGYETYQNMLAGEQAAGQSAIDLANAQAQQLGMAQAQTVKNITDQLKAERMSMLRAGMSESQIASQDMQNMIANTNALNEQIAASNMAAFQGQQQANNAQYTAYQNWLNTMNQTGANASAMAAADAGDTNMQTLKRMNKTGESYGTASSHVNGEYTANLQNQNQNKK